MTRRVRWWVPAAVVGGVVVVAGTVLAVLFATRDDPDARPVEEAIDEFRGRDEGGPDAAGIPPAGVFLLTGEGRESISFPPVTQDDGATMPMTIEGTGEGCFTARIDYNEAHWQDWQLCREGDTLVELGGHTSQRWDFGALTVENLSTFVCDPPVPFAMLDGRPGDVAERSCRGTNDEVSGETTSAGTVEVVARETLDVGGEDVETVHVARRNRLSGAQSGSEQLDLWLRVEDGLPVRGERSVVVDSDSPIGTITYTEDGTWQLTSTVPQR